MKQINFSFFSDGSEWPLNIRTRNVDKNKIPSLIRNTLYFDKPVQVVMITKGDKDKIISQSKTRVLLKAIERREGRAPKEGEPAKYGRLEKTNDGRELVFWKSKPLVFYGPVNIDEKAGRAEFNYKILV